MMASQPFAHRLPNGSRPMSVAPSEHSETPVRSLVQFALRRVSRYIQRTFLQPFADRQIEDGGD
jgi:hypothetical protein